MTINEIIETAASGYPDAYVLNYWDMEESKPCPSWGDTLAEFIAREINDTYDEDASDLEQLAAAASAMQKAADELQDVAQALSDLAVSRAA